MSARQTLSEILFNKSSSKAAPAKHSKVTVVGAGAVGIAAAYAMLISGTARELALVDVVADKVRGEMLDLQQAVALTKNVTVQCGTSFDVSAGSDVVVITCGLKQRPGQSRLELLAANMKIFQDMIPKIVAASPNAVLLVATNPCDIMTWWTWKLSGLPKERVIGSGTTLDSARFRQMVAHKLGVSASSVHGYVLGEHGDSSFPAWSCMSVGGTLIKDVAPWVGTEDDPEQWFDLARQVRAAAGEIIQLKGFTCWSIGICLNTLTDAILRDSGAIYPVSTLAQGQHGITAEAFVSLPCVLGRNGVQHVCQLRLNEQETKLLQDSAALLNQHATNGAAEVQAPSS
eukprot:GILI01003192.1.p1 GENE.GILI01003192.1~~GILI01003192.1.p1  ORF type:complete len:344 (+),score=114.83 GILI01003192.1:545-1576(+)